MKHKKKIYFFMCMHFLLTGCSFGATEDRGVTSGTQAGKEQNGQSMEAGFTYYPDDGIMSLEQEKYILQHLAYLEGEAKKVQ